MDDLKAQSITKETLVKHYKYGIRDIQFATDEEHSIWLAADAGAMRNITSMISFGIFGGKKQDELSEGVIEGYWVEPDATSKHSYKVSKLFKHVNNSPAICLRWCQDEHMFLVGFENGHIGLYAYDLGESKEQIKELFNMKVHNKRVLEVDVDPSKSLLYSISKGNKLRTFDYANKKFVNGKGGLTRNPGLR